MSPEKLALAKKLIGEGMDRHDALRRFIAHGVSTEDFQVVFTQALAELKMPEPKQVMPTLLGQSERFTSERKRVSPIAAILTLLIGTVVFFGGIYILLTGNIFGKLLDSIPTRGNYDSESPSPQSRTFGDAVLKKKVDSTMASVRIYKGRMMDYQGVCSDVAVVPPIMCKEMKDTVVVYAEDSTGLLYCVDGAGKSGSSVGTTKSEVFCK
ncbi:MAG: hypothetical protein RLZZ76_490 [Candidatus Parcubacteria bacterium]|jgi:hypothetical protein